MSAGRAGRRRVPALGKARTIMRTGQLNGQTMAPGSRRRRAEQAARPSSASARKTTGVVTAVRTSVLCQGSENS